MYLLISRWRWCKRCISLSWKYSRAFHVRAENVCKYALRWIALDCIFIHRNCKIIAIFGMFIFWGFQRFRISKILFCHPKGRGGGENGGCYLERWYVSIFYNTVVNILCNFLIRERFPTKICSMVSCKVTLTKVDFINF